jgi:hypothetical protein
MSEEMSSFNRNKEKFKLVGIMISLTILVVVYYETKILDLLLGIFKVECLKEKISTVSLKSFMFITKDSDAEILIEKMNTLGWKFNNNYGRGFLFSKNREEVLLVRKHHLNYYIYEVQGKEFFESRNQ